MALSQAEIFEDQFPLIQSCPSLNDIRLAQDIKDLTIEVKGGDVLHTHRVVLAARVPSLRATLSGFPRNDDYAIKWPTVSLSLATAFIHYVYTGQVKLTESNVRDLTILARILKIPNLVNWGTTFMANRVNLENLSETWNFAKSLKIEPLMDTCVSLMKKRFEDFVTTEHFVRLPAETVLGLLRSNDLSVESEDKVIGAIARWVDHADDVHDERLNVYAPAMLKEVQWHLTTTQCRSRLMETYPTFWRSFECTRTLFQIVNWIGNADHEQSPCPFNLRSRQKGEGSCEGPRHVSGVQDEKGVAVAPCYSVVRDETPRPRQAFFLFGVEKDQRRWSALRCGPHLQEEERIAEMQERWWASYSVVNESIFVVGGWKDSRRVEELLVREGCWRERAPLNVPRWGHAAAVLKVEAVASAAASATATNEESALIGVFGGCLKEGNTWTRISSCEVYDVSRDSWHKLPNLREKRWSPAAATLPGDNRVFVFGGFDGSFYQASVEFCHLAADWQKQATSPSQNEFWLPAAPMRTARSGLAATPFRGRILVAGGYDSQKPIDSVEMFTPPDASCCLGQWTEITGMKEPRCYFTLLTSSDTIFAIGGNDDEPKNTVEVLTTVEGSADINNYLTSWTWSSVKPFGTLHRIVGAAGIRM
nr:unnamed protein product [Spirometra erinaceieuropaei]